MHQQSMFSFDPVAPQVSTEVAAVIDQTVSTAISREASRHTALAQAAEAFAEMLARDVRLESPLVTSEMTRAFGGSDASGAWTVQDSYNAIESGLVRVLLRSGVLATERTDVLARAACVARLDRLEDLLVTRRRRSDAGERLQQYSTPPAFAFAAAIAAGITADDLVLEPSAGTGLLAVFATLANARLAVNELDLDRLALLAPLEPIAATSHDARYLSALYSRTHAPSVVLMNPPFSIDANLGSDRRVRGLALSHIEQALRLLRRGGRLVAITGHSQHPGVKPQLWEEIAMRATVRAAFTVDGSAYRRMGTSFPTALVVLDAVVDDTPPLLYTEPVGIADLVRALDQLPARGELDAVSAPRKTFAIDTSKVTKRVKRDIVAPFTFREVPLPVVYRARTDHTPVSANNLGFAAYEPQAIVIEGAQKHVTAVVESAALACVRPPMPTYVPSLMPSLIRNGALSAVQLEAVIYAGEAHAQTFELVEMDPETKVSHSFTVRRGWMSGYGTGVGKGRINAAIVADNFAAGRKRAVWFSESPTLQNDAERDWKALTGNTNTIFNLVNFPVDTKIDRDHGILFATYATLRSRSKTSERTRLEQICEWLGDDFDGCIIFDECHNLANAIPGAGAIAKASGSLQGQAGLSLQRQLPNARLVYVSATAASKIDALAYAPRLGLWGANTAFPTREIFLTTLGDGGTAALELLCRDMKALGMYLAASLSYEGVSFERLTHELSPEQIEQFNVLARTWRLILKNVHKAIESSEGGTLQKAAALAALEASRLRSLQAMTTSQKLPTVLRDIEDELAAGNSIVIQLTNTNEASQERALARLEDGQSLDDLDMSPKQMLVDYVERSFPVTQYVDTLTADGNVIQTPLLGPDGEPVRNPEAVAMRDALLEEVVSVLCPAGPLDALIEYFGADRVAEITGRSRRVITRDVNGVPARIIQDRGAHTNGAEMNAFMDGTKRILIFSEAAGGTGFSYHADLDAKNQEQRVHYLLQTGYRSDRALQGMGRTLRTHQRCNPRYKLCVSDIPGEKRFISVIARRLEALGALTRGQRDATSGGLFSAEDNLETSWANLALAMLLRRIDMHGLPGLTYAEWLAQTDLHLRNGDGASKAASIPITRFLNRVLCCDLGPGGGIQSLILDALMEQLAVTVADAKAQKKYDLGIQSIDALSLTQSSEDVIATHKPSGATTSLVAIRAVHESEPHRFGRVYSTVKDNKGFFFVDPQRGISAFYPIVATREVNGTLVHLGKFVTPTSMETVESSAANEIVRYKIGAREAEDLWDAALEAADKTYTRDYMLITGTLLPIYDRLPQEMPEVFRLVLDDGSRLIGRLIPENQRLVTLSKLGVASKFGQPPPRDALYAGAVLTLANRTTLRTVMFNHTQRIEVVLPSERTSTMKNVMIARGFIVESVSYRLRYFIPTGEKEERMLNDLIAESPIVFD